MSALLRKTETALKMTKKKKAGGKPVWPVLHIAILQEAKKYGKIEKLGRKT